MLVLSYLILPVFSLMYQFLTHKSESRKRCIVFVFVIYYVSILVAQLNLYSLGLYFHPSDPSVYYEGVKGLATVHQVIEEFGSSSNVYYFLVNWSFAKSIENPLLSSVLIKISNFNIFISAYLYATKRYDFKKIELLVLLHPYLVLTALRNVRDLHILSMMLVCMNILASKKIFIVRLLYYFSFIFLRSFYFVFFITVDFFNNHKLKIERKHYFLLLILLVLMFFTSDSVYKSLLLPLAAGVGFYNEYDAQYSYIVGNIMNTNRSVSFLSYIVLTIFVAIIRFIFTPLVPSYFYKYIESDFSGIFLNIYTDLDMFLILLGALLNVFYFIPLYITKLIHIFNKKESIDSAIIFSLLIVLIYSLFHLGGTDIRIRYSYIFCFSLSYIIFGSHVKISKQITFVCGIVLFVIPLIFVFARNL